jgi:hypothetical protein
MDGSLTVWIKDSKRVDLIVEEFDSIRKSAAGGKEIDDSAAQGILPRRYNLAHRVIARGAELLAKALEPQ